MRCEVVAIGTELLLGIIARRTLPDYIALLRNAKVSIADNEC